MSGKIKLIPLLIIVSFLSFSVRLSAVITGFSNLPGAAYAESAPEKKEAEHKEENSKDSEYHGDDSEKKKDAKEVSEKEANAPKWRDANDESVEIDDVKLELFEDLSKRKELLDVREKDLQVREALLQAAEQEVERKVDELGKLRKELEGLLGVQSEEEEKRIIRLVKIYEGMKPTNAANVFNTLDLDVLIDVMSRMSERKVAPVLSAMNPERARTVTIMMADKKKLPVLE